MSTFPSREKEPLYVRKQPYKFKIGDKIRAIYISNLFTRHYDTRWSGDIFIITMRFMRSSLPVYNLNNFNDKEIQGTFYQLEVDTS